MDDDSTSVMYYVPDYVPDYVLITGAIEITAAVVVLVACLFLVRRSAAARIGALGALLAGASTGLGTACSLAVLYRDSGPWDYPDWVWQAINYGRAGGLVLIGLAVVPLTGRAGVVPAETA